MRAPKRDKIGDKKGHYPMTKGLTYYPAMRVVRERGDDMGRVLKPKEGRMVRLDTIHARPFNREDSKATAFNRSMVASPNPNNPDLWREYQSPLAKFDPTKHRNTLSRIERNKKRYDR